MQSTVSVPAPADRSGPVIQAAMAFPMETVVARHMKEDRVSKKRAKMHERELRRYLAICALHPSERFPMFPKVDGAWHAFLLHTKDYRRFCETVAGRFIDHAPNNGTEDRVEVAASYTRFKAFYEFYFDAPPSAEFWPKELKGHVSCSGDLRAASDCTQDTCGDSCESSCVTCR